MKGSFLLLACLLSLAGSAQPQATRPAPPTKPAITLTLTTAKDNVQVGSRVVLDVVMENVSDREICFPRRYSTRDYKVSVHGDEGGPVRRVPRPRGYWMGGGSSTKVCTEPGHTRKEALDLSDYRYVLTRPGKYSIRVSTFDRASKTWVKSNTVTIKIKAK